MNAFTYREASVLRMTSCTSSGSQATTKRSPYRAEKRGGFAEDGAEAHPDGALATLSPAMYFKRLLWFLTFQVYGKGHVTAKRKAAGDRVKA